MKHQNENEQKLIELIVANPNPAIQFLRLEEVDQRETNAPQGEFFVRINGVTHPCYWDENRADGYRVDIDVVYDEKNKACRQYDPSKPIEEGRFIYYTEKY